MAPVEQEIDMSGIVLTLPIVAGKVEAWRRFCQEMSGSRGAEHEASRRGQGFTSERLTLVETPYGAEAITAFEAHEMGSAVEQLLTSNQPFDRWYRNQIQILHGISLTGYEQFSQSPPLLENQEMLFEWMLPPTNSNGRVS
jgi:hypothetical protein